MNNLSEETSQLHRVWAKHLNIPDDKIEAWIANPNRQYHCVFCNTHGDFTTTAPEISKIVGTIPMEFQYCKRCKEYKGIEPCIPSHCEFGEE